MDDTGNVTQDRQQDVDEQVSTASSLKEDTDGGQEDGKNDLEDVTSGESHFVGWGGLSWFGCEGGLVESGRVNRSRFDVMC